MATSARYGSPWLRHGDGTIYRGTRAVAPEDSGGPTLPSRRRITLRFYDGDGLKLGEVSSEVQRQVLVSADWELLPSGPGRMTFTLAGDVPGGVTLTHGTRVDVHLWGATAPIYSGRIQRIPSALSSEWPKTYEAFGYQAQLERVLVADQTYTAQRVWEIVDHLVRTYVEGATEVVYSSAAISHAATYRVNELRLRVVTPKKALEQLAGLAGLYEWGVDANRQFFFRPESTEVLHHWWVGKHLSSADIDEDSAKVVNRVWIQHGKRSSEGDNYLEEPLDDTDSQATYGLWEGVVRAPNVYHQTDAYRYGSIELARKSQPLLRANVKGIPFTGSPIECRGRARIVGPTGAEEETPLRRVRYRVTGVDVDVDVELGEREPSLARWVSEVLATQDRLDLMQQQTNRQIAL